LNWKALLLACLIVFAATLLITSVTNTTISTVSLGKITELGDHVILNTELVEPAGDEVDNPWAPK
jgi:hypothetical protein